MSNLFVDDENINASKSPFSSYKNEIAVYNGSLNQFNIEEIVFKVKRGTINSLDYIILDTISHLEFSTSRQITKYLNMKNVEIDQEKVHSRLNFLNKLGVISRFKFSYDQGTTNLRIYCIEKNGKYLLISRNYETRWKQTDNARPIDTMKEILSRNQLMLSLREKLSNLSFDSFNSAIRLNKSGKYLTPHLSITFGNSDEHKRVLFEVVRSYDGYIDKTIKRLLEYQEYFEYFIPTEEVPFPPQLIIVGEDDVHNFEIFRTIIKNKLTLKSMKYLYTSDLRLLDENLTHSIIEFSIKTSTDVKIEEISFF